MPPAHANNASELAALQAEVLALRKGLWTCYDLAGGDLSHTPIEAIGSDELVPLVIDCVRDLRGFFDAARRDLR